MIRYLENNEKQNINDNITEKNDTTISTTTLPQTGKNNMPLFITITIMIILTIAFFIKFRSMKLK